MPTPATSRPPRARGLKRGSGRNIRFAAQSRPPRARGLKPVERQTRNVRDRVAPPAGAWIETRGRAGVITLPGRRAPRGRVD